MNIINKSIKISGKAWTREDSSKRTTVLNNVNEKRINRIKKWSNRGYEFIDDFNSNKNECSHELMKTHND